MLQAFGAAEVAVAKRRVGALLADPAMRLPDLATECLSLSGEPPRMCVPCQERASVGGCHVCICRCQGLFNLIHTVVSLPPLLPLRSQLLLPAGGEASEARERVMHESIHRMLSRSGGAMKVCMHPQEQGSFAVRAVLLCCQFATACHHAAQLISCLLPFRRR